jgi:hypothetical protein
MSQYHRAGGSLRVMSQYHRAVAGGSLRFLALEFAKQPPALWYRLYDPKLHQYQRDPGVKRCLSLMLYCHARMRSLFHAMRSRVVSLAVVVLTLGALCFSVGEGLRLTPFPSHRANPESTSPIDETSQSSAFKAGPLDVPTQPQKRTKRFAIEVALPVSSHSGESIANLYPASEHQSELVSSSLLVAIPAGRAPPFTS